MLQAFSDRDTMDERPATVELAGIVLDSSTGEATVDGQPLRLTRTEFRVLFFLLQSDGRVFNRDEIIAAVQGSDYPVTARAIDNHILSLRRKLGARGDLIETIRGAGYRRRVS